jgi:hypothetical protein
MQTFRRPYHRGVNLKGGSNYGHYGKSNQEKLTA